MSTATRKGTAWRDTPAGHAAYLAARAEAQAKANETGYDYGLEANDLFKQWRVFMLPRKENRAGHELRCEVVLSERPRETVAQVCDGRLVENGRHSEDGMRCNKCKQVYAADGVRFIGLRRGAQITSDGGPKKFKA